MTRIALFFAIVGLLMGCGGTKSNEVETTREAAPAAIAAPVKVERPGVKPHFVPCDPERPELPCTPETPPLDLEGEPKPAKGVKPHFVPCDPKRPDLPCTPDTPPPGLDLEAPKGE